MSLLASPSSVGSNGTLRRRAPQRVNGLAARSARASWWRAHGAQLLVLALALGTFAGRFRALTAHYPFLAHPDEQVIVERATHIVETGDLNPHFLSYPSLCIYLLAGIYAPLDALGIVTAQSVDAPETARPEHYVIARVVSLLSSCATLLVVAVIARRIAGSLAGVSAALFLATSTLATIQSIQATVNAPLTLLAALTCWAVLRLDCERADVWSFVLAGALAGATIGAKYIGWPACFLVLAALPLQGPRSTRRTLASLFAFAAAVVLTFLLTTPYAALDPAALLEDVGVVRGTYSGRFPGNEAAGDTSYLENADVLVRRAFSPLPLALAGAGFAWLVRTQPRRAALLALYPALLFAFIGSYRVFFERNLLSAIAFLAVLAGCGLFACAHALERIASRARAAPRWVRSSAPAGVGALALAAILPPLASSWKHIAIETRPDARNVALEWIRDNLPPGSRVVREDHTPLVESLGPFDVRKIGCLVRPDHRRELEEGDYVVVTRRHYGKFARAGREEEMRAYDEFFAENELVAEFSKDDWAASGPTVLIYACREPDAKAAAFPTSSH